MACSKIKKILFILLCLFVLLFPFWCVRGLCAEVEEVEFSTVSGISISTNSNYFVTSSGAVGYFQLEKGYIYHISRGDTGGTSPRNLALSNEIPVLNGTYELVAQLYDNESYSILVDNSNQYMYFDFSITNGITVTREKLENMDGVVNDLVNNVGIQSLWNTFNNANPFILVVVLFSFGLFIIIALVRKLRKGKGGI